MQDLVKIIEKIPGFKLANSHFLIGSKIHLSEFYFAKRLFQNSFFASKFAFLIARYIIEKYNKNDFSDGLTLIGYGLYSELLLSLVEHFIRNKWKFKDDQLNHNIVNDREDLKLIKGYEKPLNNVLLIIPIVSTFSTSIKIEEELSKKFNVVSPHISVLLVSDGNLTNSVTPIERKFGWQSINTETRTVKVNAFYENKIIDNQSRNSISIVKEQKYLLALPSKWQDIIDCQLCFPEDPLKEKSLHFTDKTSVTPSLIYDMPKGRAIYQTDLKREYSIRPEMLEYHHLNLDDMHFNYFIYIEKFFNENKINIKSWLFNEIKKKINYKETEYALILAPGHYSNAGFVNLVNEVLFSNSANILHYDSKKDHIQNFQLFYRNEVKNADKIYYVDDTMTTGNTFSRANYFVRHTRNKIPSLTDPGFDACILLFDRSSFFVQNNILRKLPINEKNKISDRLFSFANLHLPALNFNRGKCPICKEKERYEMLKENSFLDRLKVHFIHKSMDISLIDISSTNKYNDSVNNNRFNYEDENRYLKRIGTIHRIYEWFNKNNSLNKFNSFDEWCRNLIDTTTCPFPKASLKLDKEDFSDDRATILKVLIQPPFADYQPIRIKVFGWLNILLNKQIKKVEYEIKVEKLQYESFKDLKFLIRRAGLLNANYLMRENVFNVLKLLFGENILETLVKKEVDKINEKKEKEEYVKEIIKAEIERLGNKHLQSSLFEETSSLPKDKIKIIDEKLEKLKIKKEDITKNVYKFKTYYTAQIKELLFLNEARSIHLERTLLEYKKNSKDSLSFQQLLRMLQEENCILIEQFWEFAIKNSKWEGKTINQFISDEEIKNFLNDDLIKSHYRYITLLEFFKATNQKEPSSNIAFLNYLWLMNFFSVEKNAKSENIQERNENYVEEKGYLDQPTQKTNITLSQKTNYILDKMKKIVFQEDDDNNGAFFIVEYNPNANDPYFLAYNKGKSSSTIENINDNKNNFLLKFIEGVEVNSEIDQSKKTIIELYRNNENRWVDLYSIVKNDIESNLDSEFISLDFNRLLLIRINRIQYDPDKEIIREKSKGLIGFYFNQDNDDITDVNITRYLLLLRSELSMFINKHHENNEFWEWREANLRNRLTLLTGHGRGMLLDIAIKKGSRYRSIIDNMLLIQQFILNHEDEIRINEYKEAEVTQKQFNDYYTYANDDNEYNMLTDLAYMVTDIYRNFDEVENKVSDVKIYLNGTPIEINNDSDEKINDPGNKYFIKLPFRKAILELISFEILVNAKKNRWHFNVQKINGYDENSIYLDSKLTDDKLEITISNTGPYVSQEMIDKLNNKKTKNIKNDGNDSAGLALIRTILATFMLGEIEFNSKEIDSSIGFGIFIIKLIFPYKFNPINNGNINNNG